MMQKTTQCGLRQAIFPLTSSYIVDHFDLNGNELADKWNMDYFKSRVKSIRFNVGSFVFTNGNFVEA